MTLDERDERPGWKFAEWELRGVPLRLEIGPKDIEKAQVLIARRDTREKIGVPMAGMASRDSRAARPTCRDPCYERAVAFRDEHTQRVGSYDEFKQVDGRPARLRHRPLVRLGRVRSARSRTDTQATIRNMPIDGAAPGGTCVRCDSPATAEAWFAKSY